MNQEHRVFIASSKEAKYMVDDLILCLKEIGMEKPEMVFLPRPWFKIFRNGEYTLDALMREFQESSIGIFLFTRDEIRESRGERKYATRENVVLEYGLFLSQNSRQNVGILAEEDVIIPSDLSGITFNRFNAEQTSRESFFRSFLRDFKKSLLIAPQKDLECATRLGFSRTLKDFEVKIAEINSQLQFRDNLNIKGPIVFDNTASVSTYSEALDICKESFWTTTFLTSGFWTRHDPLVKAANQRISRKLGSTGNVRRLFLLGRLRKNEIRYWQDHIKHLRQSQDEAGLNQVIVNMEILRRNINQMVKDGCQVRVCFDETQAFRQVPDLEMNDRPLDTEIAIYDNSRVDFFSGGGVGEITKVRCFTEVSSNFNVCLAGAKTYFESLWESAESAEKYIEVLGRAVDSAKDRIDYTSNWLMTYEYCLPKEDKRLKDSELEKVIEKIKGRWQKPVQPKKLLDIGTCTARYPLELHRLFSNSKNVELIGIDDDEDAISVAKYKVEAIDRIKIFRCDFLNEGETLEEHGKFDIITCMLGTISHFCAKSEYFQKSLERIRELLADTGLLFIGTWSDFAVKHRKLLSIYSPNDCTRLASWTPSEANLESQLKIAGFRKVEKTGIEERLKLFTCSPTH